MESEDKMNKSKKEKKSLKRKRDKHHLTPRSRNGNSNQSNLLLIKISRHRGWHSTWGNRTLDEVIAILLRVQHAKQSQRFKQLEIDFP